MTNYENDDYLIAECARTHAQVKIPFPETPYVNECKRIVEKVKEEAEKVREDCLEHDQVYGYKPVDHCPRDCPIKRIVERPNLLIEELSRIRSEMNEAEFHPFLTKQVFGKATSVNPRFLKSGE